MATAVFFHAHPDDEAIATGGTMVRAAAAGHRVVLVCATDGAVGEVDDGVLAGGETLASRRADELEAAAELLGVDRLEFLGYRDSGMVDTETNSHPESFWQADVDEAAERLAGLLREEGATVLTCYDDHGGYGHPDHIQVHRVGHRAAQLAGVEHLYESTMNRDHLQALMEMAVENGDMPDPPDAADAETFGSPDVDITTAVDVSAVIETKKAAMAAHGSQIDEQSFFLSMPDEAFAMAFGTEWYIRIGATPADRETELQGLPL